jgi:hypothetical protein
MRDMVEVVITVNPTKELNFDDVVTSLLDFGLEHTIQHKVFSIVIGSIPKCNIDRLSALPGVASVREEQEYKG